MEFKTGDRVKVSPSRPSGCLGSASWTGSCTGAPSPRYRISWDDGHESAYAPAAGALSPDEPAERAYRRVGEPIRCLRVGLIEDAATHVPDEVAEVVQAPFEKVVAWQRPGAPG